MSRAGQNGSGRRRTVFRRKETEWADVTRECHGDTVPTFALATHTNIFKQSPPLFCCTLPCTALHCTVCPVPPTCLFSQARRQAGRQPGRQAQGRKSSRGGQGHSPTCTPRINIYIEGGSRLGSHSHSSRNAPWHNQGAQCAFEKIMTREGMHITNVIAFHHVLHHNGNQDIHC